MKSRRKRIAVKLLWWMPWLMMMVYTAAMAASHDFVPLNYTYTEVYMLLLGVVAAPLLVFSTCSLLGWAHNRYHHTRQLWGERIGAVLAAATAATFIYGFTIGFNQVTVRHADLTFNNLPDAFDGYRIAHVSDLHVGTYGGWRKEVLAAVIDSIKQEQPDIICFTGDLQNTRPHEVEKVSQLLRQLPGTYSVLGNHDHGEYAGGTNKEKQDVEQQLIATQRRLGWNLLINQASIITRQRTLNDGTTTADSIAIVGTDNDGMPPFPSLARYDKAMGSIAGKNIFTIMLQHDPSAWKRNIVDKTQADLTLSGHTHGGQMQALSLRPTMLTCHEDYGHYTAGKCQLMVSAGAGALVPFRIGLANEITIITLHTAKH